MSKSVVSKYRKAARKLFGANAKEANWYIKSPEEDKGGWAPESLAIIYLECDGRFPEDQFSIPSALDYYGAGFDNCVRLQEEAGVGYVEYVNAAVAAVWP